MNEIKTMFNNLAKNYDFFNNIISFGFHKTVRRIAIKTLNIQNRAIVLDLCCGTGDFGEIAKQFQPNCEVIGVDFSEEMLKIAEKKNTNIKYFIQNATAMNFENNKFDYVIMGFGLRNIPDKEAAIKEIYRILKPNGKILQLDFGEKSFFNSAYNGIILNLINLFTKESKPFKYLIKSKDGFLPPKQLSVLFEKFGFKTEMIRYLLFGIISFQIYKKCN